MSTPAAPPVGEIPNPQDEEFYASYVSPISSFSTLMWGYDEGNGKLMIDGDYVSSVSYSSEL